MSYFYAATIAIDDVSFIASEDIEASPYGLVNC